ncbi:ABC transporter ATP-binding protein [Embleya sp. AB8]|uniref:ABC transporter ATP-binding protein n=1 Tax=Embleya sp. AB8 TaxID=3156304 RepID=UPI003C769C9E
MIEVQELTKRYGTAAAVDNLTFSALPGRVTGFLGPNGAGKSTTMRMILALVAPTHGTAFVNDRPYAGLRRPLREVGTLLDANAVHGGRSAYDHLAWVARSNGIGRRRVTEVLTTTGLEAVARKRIGQFSLGMKQRLGVASALLADPPVLIFDEPLNGLDTEGIRWLRNLLKSLAAEGRTVFYSSHLMSEMALTADHLVVIGRGRLIADTTVADLVASGAQGDVLIRSPQGSAAVGPLVACGGIVTAEPDGGFAVVGLDPTTIAEIARAHGLTLTEITPRHPSLEEVFMQLTEDSVEYRTDAPAKPGRRS